MDSPSSTNQTTPRSHSLSILNSFRLTSPFIDKQQLRTKLLIPQHIRLAIINAIASKDVTASIERHSENGEVVNVEASERPVVVFVNSKSGGRHGNMLIERLQHLICEEQVFNLKDVKPHEFVQYGLACLEKLANLGDECAQKTRERLRIVVAGGDGTVGWVLGCLQVLNMEGRMPVPPVGIIPLGTGNDLSRTFGWGGSIPFAWKPAVKRSLQRAVTGPICHLDSWKVVLQMPSGEVVDPPHSLKLKNSCSLDQGSDVKVAALDDPTCYEGVFYNYFSIGMDAQVAYGFHNLRNEKPYIAQSPIANKLIYSGYSLTQGWFFTPCTTDPGLRGLKNILRIHIKKANCSEWEQIKIPKSVRAIVAFNLPNYASGRNPWGNLSRQYLEKRGFVEAHADDGLLEIFGLKHGWHASFVMAELITAKHIAQAEKIRLEFSGGKWENAYMQMDGEQGRIQE